MNTLRAARLGLPLLAAGLVAACGNKDEDEDTDPPVIDTDEEDTGPTGPRFTEIDGLNMIGYVSFDADGAVTTQTIQGQQFPSAFVLSFESGGETACFALIEVTSANSAYRAASGGDTADSAAGGGTSALATWLTDNQADWGFEVFASGATAGAIDIETQEPCNLDPELWTDDPVGSVLSTNEPYRFGFPRPLSSELEQALQQNGAADQIKFYSGAVYDTPIMSQVNPDGSTISDGFAIGALPGTETQIEADDFFESEEQVAAGDYVMVGATLTISFQ